jgi:hypothetical protein
MLQLSPSPKQSTGTLQVHDQVFQREEEGRFEAILFPFGHMRQNGTLYGKVLVQVYVGVLTPLQMD